MTLYRKRCPCIEDGIEQLIIGPSTLSPIEPIFGNLSCKPKEGKENLDCTSGNAQAGKSRFTVVIQLNNK